MPWSTSWSIADLATGSSGGNAGYLNRQLIAASLLTTSGSKGRITLNHNSVDYKISGCYIGHQASSGDPYDFDGGQVKVTFDSGADGCTISAGVDKVSDEITFALDETKAIVISYYVSDAAFDDFPYQNSVANATNYYAALRWAEYADTNIVAALSSVASQMQCINKIETFIQTTEEGSISEDASVNDVFTADVYAGRSISEDVSVDDFFDDNIGVLSEDVSVNDFFDDNLGLISEDVSVDDAFSTAGSTFNAEIYEESSVHAEILGTARYALTINDGMDLADATTVVPVYYKTCDESLILTDTASVALSITAEDGAMLYDDAQPGWGKTVSDGFDIADTVAKILGIPCPDSLTLQDSVVTKWVGQEIINEILEIYDLPKDIFQFSKTVNDGFDIADTLSYRLAVTVIENILLTEAVSATKDFIETINDTAALTDEATRGFEKTIDESLVNTDTVAVITSFFNSIAESLTATDTNTMVKRLWETLTDTIAFVDTVASKGTLYNVVYDTLGLLAEVEFAGETWECYILNTPKFYPSMYSGFNFNSYAVFENRAFGANDVGIYELTGDTDAGAEIHTGVVLNETDFNSPNQKRFRRAYLGISGTAPKMVFECEDGKREVYDIDTEGKTVVSSDLKSKSWKLSIADFEELSSMKLIPVVLTK